MSKVWFITGAGSGIGSGTAKAALRSGDRVVATGRNFEKVRNVYPDVVQENIAFVQLDVANEAQAKAAVDEAMKRFGRIGVLVNNAGYSVLERQNLSLVPFGNWTPSPQPQSAGRR